ncbi:MAG: LysR substrate-binding domain-containing protein [Bryobacteraceae bacterium]|nr:LysR substrate-binding domain-containing protein [Bryobacteraceae bacterium]
MNSVKLGIELTHLRYFVVVAEELHFGRAARKLAISQPPLTQQIQRLEARIGFALFERSTRHTALTDAGATLLPLARAALEDVDRAVDAARRAGRGEVGQFVVATPPSVMLGGLPRLIRWFRRTLPDTGLLLREMSTSAVMEALESGSVDVGFLRCPQLPARLRELFRYREDVAIVLPRHHRLAAARRLKLHQLSGEPFVFFPRRLGEGFHDELLQLCRQAGFEPRIVQEATQWSTVVALVESGLGVTIGPASIARLTARGCVARILPGMSTTVLLACGQQPLKGAARRFAEACQARL